VTNYVAKSATVQASWDNHFAAFGSQNVEQILKDYTETSVINVYNQSTGTQKTYKGIAGATDCFTGLFKALSDLSDLAAPVIEVHEPSGEEPGSVLLIWSCKASGFQQATDTFIFDAAGKIVRQNVVCVNTNEAAGTKYEETPSTSGPIRTAWDNHFGAFGGQNVADILKDYTEASIITVYNQADGTKTEFKGLTGVQDCFTGLFKSLHDCSDLAAPVQHVEESDSGVPSVFLVWSCGASGYAGATDTFIFNASGKILRQNVVTNYVAK